MTLPMFNKVASYAAPYFKVLLGGVFPKNELVLCILFAVLLFMGLFRGPLTLFGCGAATLGVVMRIGDFSLPFLYALFAIPTITVNIGSCITQSWVAWGTGIYKGGIKRLPEIINSKRIYCRCIAVCGSIYLTWRTWRKLAYVGNT